MASIRTFLAVPLPAALQHRFAALQKELAGVVGGVRWTPPENLHLTLRFFGDVTQEDLEKLKASVLSVERTERAFDVMAKGLGAFPDPCRPRVIWLGLEPAAPLLGLYRACQDALLAQGFAAEDRPFAPHLTLGRLRRRGPDLTSLARTYAARTFGNLPVTRLVLYQSRLHRGGAEHLPLLTVALAAPGTSDCRQPSD